ncbi:MAG: hypothetical protein R6X02_15315 [Enhygromyxa sp.]
MSSPSLLRRAVLGPVLVSACLADNTNEHLENSPAFDGTESSDGVLADPDTPDPDAPDPDADPFLSALDRVEFSSPIGNRIELLAYDTDDRHIGTLALQHQGIESIQLIADFKDGAALIEIDRDAVIMRDSELPDIVVARRAEAMGLEIDMGAQEGWLKCAAMTAITIHNCWNPATAL